MTPPHREAAILAYNQAVLAELQRAMRLRPGRFSLILARCNYVRLRHLVLEALLQSITTVVFPLPAQISTLREAIRLHLGNHNPEALMVIGLEGLEKLGAVLKAANLGRDEFPKEFPFPLVLWVNDRILQQINRYAPDLKSFAAPPISFQYPPGELLNSLYERANELFAAMLSLGDDSLYPGHALAFRQGSSLRIELEFALEDIAQQGPLDAELDASLDFLKGRDAFSRGELDLARYFFEKSLTYWQAQTVLPEPPVQMTAAPIAPPAASSPTPHEKQAVLLFYLGATLRSQAALQRVIYRPSLQKAEQYFEACLNLFRTSGRSDLVGQFLHAQAEVLQKLGNWADLEQVAREGLQLHRSDPVRLARDHGYLAEVALARHDSQSAQAEAVRALEILKIADAVSVVGIDPTLDLESGLSVANRFQRGWYLYLLARVQIDLNQPENAIAFLTLARQQTQPKDDLILYRNILETLRQQYYHQKDYRAAFHVKLEQRQVETRFKLRAFIGAGQIPPYESPLPAPLEEMPQSRIATEIEASGRQGDVEALVVRLEAPRYQFIVIHGPSGVGKSSILSAGLVPALWKSFPEGRSTLPVLVKTYRDWPDAVSQSLDAALQQQQQPNRRRDRVPSAATVDRYGLVDRLKTLIDRYFQQIVLVFDQFEEFFVEAPQLPQRREFYAFLTACLNTPYLKVVMALREDYLHYLLEAERLFDLDIINNDILSRDVRYYLGNFKPEQAEELVRRLTAGAHFYLEEPLIRQFVEDLAGEAGEVRPIELQVVGSQLQREGIETLEEYEELGSHPKETLVQRFLSSVVEDCGPENADLANLVLYLLTDEDRENRLYRPLKSREELEEELLMLRVRFTPSQLDLVLEILVGSGLIFISPEVPEDRYQLVHDYLMNYVRDGQNSGLIRNVERIHAEYWERMRNSTV